MTEAVKVIVRCRPMSTKQKQRGCKNVVNIDSASNQVRLIKTDSQQPPKAFSFDCVFGVQSLQSHVYEQTAFSLVDNVLEGYNGTIFAYGQTGCGKTHTMMGSTESEESKGIIPRTFHQIITLTNSQTDKKHLVQCSFIQIYNQQIHDLLGKDVKARMQLKQSPDKGLFVKDLSMNIVKTQIQMQKFMDIGFKNRAVRQTAMNKQSSRSHSIFTIHIQSEQIDQFQKQKFKVGKLNLVDLAGSQRQSKTQTTGDGMKQAAKINLSLSALGNVISALVDGKTHHIPYRDSKLTRLLQDSLGGNTKTIMIACLSPADYNYDQTLSSLRYASRAKFIKNKPVINEDPKDTLLREYAEQIKKLKMMLQGKTPLNASQIKISSEGKPQVIYKEVMVERSSNVSSPGKGSNQSLQNELKSKQDQLRHQQEQKQRLKEQMQKLKNLISHEQKIVDRKELQRMNKLKERLKVQKKKQEQYVSQKRKRQQELLNLESNYKSLNEEVESMRSKFSRIKAKYMENVSEIRDIQMEHERQKEALLDTIRQQQSESSKYSSILKMLLNNDQIQLIIQQSQYNDESRQWTIAPFYYRQKNINFPKLPPSQTKQLIQNQKDKKQVIFKDQDYLRRDESYSYNNSRHQNGLSNSYNYSRHQAKGDHQKQAVPSNNAISKSKDSFKISDVVKNARQQKQYTREREKSQYSNKNNIDFQQYQKYDNKGLSSLTSLGKISDLNPTPKVPKHTQLTPIKVQSEQRIKLDQVNLNNGLYNNAATQRIKLDQVNLNNGLYNNGASQQISSKNSVKLNPLNSKR